MVFNLLRKVIRLPYTLSKILAKLWRPTLYAPEMIRNTCLRAVWPGWAAVGGRRECAKYSTF